MEGKRPLALAEVSYQPYVPVEPNVILREAISLEAPLVTVRARRYSRVYEATFLAVLRISVSLELV
jgi:hypothetical protein